ncbi:MAG: cation transporter [Candidatus Shapirobacteria bacterium]|nr:cation transporter [Candidatus Shapirobacteria bacterium]
MQTVTFSIPDMHCPSCPKLIKLTLLDIDGVNEVEASLDTKKVVVNFDSQKTSVVSLINSIKETGYTASLK